MSSFAIYNNLNSDSEEDCTISRRHIRDASNPLELPDAMFIRYFRVSKDIFRYLLHIIETNTEPVRRSSSVNHFIKLSASLRFFGEGCYQKGGGNDLNVGVAQSTFSIILKEVLDIFENHLCPYNIKFPTTPDEILKIKEDFYRKFRFPGVIGCVDGSHIRICAPSKDERHLYYNRKGFYSLNAMLVCDHEMKITFVDSKFPGSCHDSHVFNLSSLDLHLQNNGEINTWLIGDSGYGLKPYLMTPYRVVDDNRKVFNVMRSKARNIIERTIGVLKNRFRCLIGARELHYKPKKCKQIVNVCCALHNLCIAHRLSHFEEDIPAEILRSDNEVEDLSDSPSAETIRDRIMNSLL